MSVTLALIWLLASGDAHAQAPADDVELWGTAGVSADLPDGWETGLTQHIRLAAGPLRLWEFYTDLEGSHRPVKWLVVELGLRGGGRQVEPGVIEPRLRGTADLRLRGKVKWFRISLRERYQLRLPVGGRDPRHTVRTKLQVGIDVSSDVRLFVLAEPYLRLFEAPVLIDQIRFDVGVRLDLPRRVDLEVFYRVEVPYDDIEDRPTHIFGVSVEKTVKRKKRKPPQEAASPR